MEKDNLEEIKKLILIIDAKEQNNKKENREIFEEHKILKSKYLSLFLTPEISLLHDARKKFEKALFDDNMEEIEKNGQIISEIMETPIYEEYKNARFKLDVFEDRYEHILLFHCDEMDELRKVYYDKSKEKKLDKKK